MTLSGLSYPVVFYGIGDQQDTVESDLLRRITNWRGGCLGIAVFLLLLAAVYCIAFMTALGNDTPEARLILEGVAAFSLVADPVWGIPLSYLAGALLVPGTAPADPDPPRKKEPPGGLEPPTC